MGYFCLIVGLFVIFAISRNQVKKMHKEIALFKVMGVSIPKILNIIVFEYLIILFAAFLLGGVISLIIGKILSDLFFDNVWSIDFSSMSYLMIILVVCCILIVLMSSYSVVKEKVKTFLN